MSKQMHLLIITRQIQSLCCFHINKILLPTFAIKVSKFEKYRFKECETIKESKIVKTILIKFYIWREY